MTARLPTPGSDDGTWGDILNSFLEVSLANDGSLNSNVVGTNQIQNNAVTNAQLDTATQNIIAGVSNKYTKPGSGIPSTDLSTGVQTSLGKADTAEQTANKGVAGGYASLDGSALLPTTQLPSSVVSASSQPKQGTGFPWVINVKDGAYGALGDGSTNDTSAIQAALNAAAALPGGAVVYLPAATYALAGVLQIGSNTELRGDGPLTVLAPSYASATNAAVITNNLLTGNTNITFRDFRLSRAGNNVEHGILLNGITNLNVIGVQIDGVPSVTSGALAVSGVLPGGSGATLMVSTNVRVRDCHFGQTNNFGVQLSYVTNATVTGCVFDDCYREAVGVEPETGCVATNVSVTGNSFTTGTIPSGGSATGVIVITESSGGTVQQVTVTGNTITNTTATGSNLNPGITVLTGGSTARGVTLEANELNGLNGNGIAIGSASFAAFGVKVIGGSVINCNASNSGTTFSGAAISLRQAVSCTVMGVYIKGTHHTAGIYESQSGVGKNTIIGNQLVDTTPFVLLAGSGTIAKDNFVRTGSGGSQTAVTRVTISAAYTMNPWEPPIIAATATASAYAVTLPAANAVPVGLVYRLVDESQGAATHNLTLQRAGSDTFTDASTSKVISVNGGDLGFYSTGSAWQLV